MFRSSATRSYPARRQVPVEVPRRGEVVGVHAAGPMDLQRPDAVDRRGPGEHAGQERDLVAALGDPSEHLLDDDFGPPRLGVLHIAIGHDTDAVAHTFFPTTPIMANVQNAAGRRRNQFRHASVTFPNGPRFGWRGICTPTARRP